TAAQEGRELDRAEILARHPDLAEELAAFFQDHDQACRVAGPMRERTPPAPPPRAFGDYEILEEIGRGGMGVVYRARQVSLNRVVALKMVGPARLAGPEEAERLRREARILADLDHPNIVPVYEVAEYEGQHYFSMKCIDGGSLTDALASRPAAWSKEAQAAAARVVARVAWAVHYAHERGVLHRDLKPANILLASGGREPPVGEPLVTDFGLARCLEQDETLSRTGAIIGTAGYIAPEQA